jgi:phosphate-selective porin
VQIVARYAALDVDDEIFEAGFAAGTASRQARQASIGANWYPVSIVKYYLTYDRTWFDGPVPRPDEHLVLFRVQLAF